MLPGQSALKIYRIRRLDWSVRTQFNRRTLYECTCCHDHIAVISRHRPGFRIHIAVDRRCCLDAFTKSNYFFRCSEGDCLNDIVAALRTVRNYCKAKTFIHVGCKNRTFQSRCRNCWCKEKSLIERLIYAQCCPYFFSKSRRSQAVCCVVYIFFLSCNITTDRSQSATWILDQRTYYQICSHICRLYRFYKLTITVIHHADHILFDLFYKINQLSDPCYRKCRSGLVPLGTLDSYQFCFLIDCFSDIFKIKRTIFQQIHLSIGNPVFRQRTV